MLSASFSVLPGWHDDEGATLLLSSSPPDQHTWKGWSNPRVAVDSAVVLWLCGLWALMTYNYQGKCHKKPCHQLGFRCWSGHEAPADSQEFCIQCTPKNWWFFLRSPSVVGILLVTHSQLPNNLMHHGWYCRNNRVSATSFVNWSF